MSYDPWLAQQAPAWFQGPAGSALWKSVAQLLDAQRDLALQSELSGFPTQGALDNTVSPPARTLPASDALDAIGYERGLPRAAAESPADSGGARDQAYAARLLAAWTSWPYGGAHYGVLRALQLAGYGTPISVQDNGRWAQIAGVAGTIADITFGSLMTCATRSSHPGWMFDARNDPLHPGDVNFYSRFGLVFTADATNLQTAQGWANLNAIVNRMQPAKDVFVASWVILAGRLLGWPTGRTLGTDPNLGTNSVRIIPGDGRAATVIGP